ncbi:GNAT family N-acetyltransferase [Lentibacillus songyuanensis]|uniref:GNAT family N-acetyltransferase n=1 Tax=Lentibacillus songyuanensis TaxID=3136161 RepID=UPI0038621A70
MKDLNKARGSLDSWRNGWLTYGYGYWTVVLSSQSEVIGIGGIRRGRWKEQEVLNLYYRFSPSYWGNGYATELGRIAVQMANDYIPDLSVVARVRPSNKPSFRVAERIGLQHCHELDSDKHMAFVSNKK